MQANNEPEVFHIESGDLRLTGARWREGFDDRPPIVLLHGGGQTRHSWRRTAARLASHGRAVVTLDARGHGDSDWDPNGDYSLDAFAGDLVAVLRTLERPVAIVGASLGGITGLVAASSHPELVSALVLVDVVVDLEPAGVERIHRFMTGYPNGFASLEEVADAIAEYNPLRERPRDPSGLRRNVRQRSDGRWYWHWDPAFMEIQDEPRRQIQPERLREAALALTVPTLIVHGARSDVVSDDGVADMLRLIPTAEVVDVAAAGHMVAGDDNDVFTSALEEFLTRLAEPS